MVFMSLLQKSVKRKRGFIKTFVMLLRVLRKTSTDLSNIFYQHIFISTGITTINIAANINCRYAIYTIWSSTPISMCHNTKISIWQ